ncbi:PAS domain S-box protein [Planosporangium mesophilum]|uniref:PAS domain S-box protein n=1 Tax=Planosporangium mesophilum TaxID=689768 RepID=UPI00143CA84E|nr:PAS domain S-box protein [Planosporangium mesophilum]NJC83217.1 PAS domain S-box protein [Planosporangium mesophilum]
MSTRITAGYLTLMAVLGVSVFAAPGWAAVTWAAVGLTSVCAVVVGVRRYAPRARAPWWLLAGAILAMAAGDTIFGAAVRRPGDPSPVMVDVCYLSMLPLVLAGLIQLTRTSVVLRDRTRLLDLLTFTCAAALVLWIVVLGPGIRANGLDGLDKSVLAAYMVGDLLLLTVSMRLMVAARRSSAVALLAVGVWGVVAADSAYWIADLSGGWQPGGPGELGYLLFYVCWGAAALRPSMVRLTMPAQAGPARLPHWWIAVMWLSLTVPAGALFVESVAGPPRNGLVIAVATIIMAALVLTRLSDAITKHRRSLARERGLREACGPLMVATGQAGVAAAIRAAIDGLAPSGAPHRVVFDPGDGAVPAGDGEGRRPSDRYPVPAPAPDRRSRLAPTRTLHPDLRGRLGGFETTLVCPLTVDLPTAGGGALFVAADDEVLGAMRDSVEVLAAQAALALERIALTDAANRHDSDRYVRTVVQNTADVVVVLDDERIRYASPSLATVLGIELPAFGAFGDLIRPEDREQVVRTLERARRSRADEGARDCWSLRRPDGTRVLVEVSCRDLRADRMVRGIVVTMRDVTAQRGQERELIRQALLDSPAGFNRRSSTSKYR